jgi:hypothetical protein
MRSLPEVVTNDAALAPWLKRLDHIDVKTVTSRVPLRAFVAGMLNYRPAWLVALFGARVVFVRLLGLRRHTAAPAPRFTPDSVPMTPGQRALFFTVRAAEDGRLWLADADDRHLWGALAVVAEPLGGGRWRYHVVTLVRYHNWSGPVYFNAIRPFHHLVVGSMAWAGARG